MRCCTRGGRRDDERGLQSDELEWDSKVPEKQEAALQASAAESGSLTRETDPILDTMLGDLTNVSVAEIMKRLEKLKTQMSSTSFYLVDERSDDC